MPELRPLDGVRVVELAGQTPARLCGKLLADAGASVTRVRLPERPAEAPLAAQHAERNRFLDTGKEVIDLALEDRRDRAALESMLGDAELYLTSWRHEQGEALGLDCETLLERHPGATVACVTPFGHTGPYAEFLADDVVLSALSGLTDATPGFPDRCPRPDDPPVQSRAALAESGGAFLAATAVFGALMPRLSGRPAPRHVEVVVLEAVVAQMAFEWGITAYGGGVSGRRTTHHALEPNVYLPCADGRVVIVAFSENHWRQLVEMMGSPAWAAAPEFATAVSRGENYQSLHARLREWTTRQRGIDVLEHAQARGVPSCCGLDLSSVISSEQIAEMGSIERRADGVFPADPIEVDGARRPSRSAAARQSAPATMAGPASLTEARAPLAGVRVLDLSQIVSGPYCGQLLAALGAEVILVESSTRLISRGFGPFTGEPAYDASAMFNQINQGKRSVQLNLATESGRRLLFELAATADVVLENLSRRAAASIGITHAALAGVRDDIILASISGFGRRGPWGDYVALHSGVILLSGLASVTRDDDDGTRLAGAIYPDLLTGTYMALAIEQALAARHQTGRGCHVEVSMLDVMLTCMADLVPLAARGETIAPHPVRFLRADEPGGFVAAPPGTDPGEVADATRREAVTRLQAGGVAAAPVLDMSEVMHDPHLSARGFIREDNHPVAGVRPIPALPWQYDGRRPKLSHAPCLGDSTDAVLRELLARPASEVATLRSEGVLV